MTAFFLSFKRTMFAHSSSPSVPPFLSILYQAFLLPFKSPSFSCPLLLLSSVSSSLLFSSTYPSLYPTLSDLFETLSRYFKEPAPPLDPHTIARITSDLTTTARVVSHLLPAVSLSSLVVLVAAVCIFSYAQTGSSLDPQTLVKRVVSRSYQTLVTGLYGVLLGLGYTCLSLFILAMVSLNSDPDFISSQALVATNMSLAGVSVLLFFYLYTRWAMAMVITVVEETWGIGALSWSVELFIGNKQVGTALTFVLMAVRMAIYGVFGFILLSEPPLPTDQQMKIGMAVASVCALWELYSLAAYTVFYYYCRKNHGLDETVSVPSAVEEGFIYASIPSKIDAA
jgi:hypothetical protein